MNCSNCQTANPPGAKFCMQCGTALAVACPNSGTELPSDAQFCFKCGHRMAEALVLAAQGQAEQALDSFARGEDLALRLQMRPLVWQARAGATPALCGLGRKDEAHTKRQEARAMIHEIAGLFEDTKLRGMYLQGATARVG